MTACWDNGHIGTKGPLFVFPCLKMASTLSGAPSPLSLMERTHSGRNSCSCLEQHQASAPGRPLLKRVWPPREAAGTKGNGRHSATEGSWVWSSCWRHPCGFCCWQPCDVLFFFFSPKWEKKKISLSKWWNGLNRERKGSCFLVLQSLYSNMYFTDFLGDVLS